MTTEAKTMRSLRFHKTSSLDDLRVEEVPIPTPSEDEVLVQVKAAAINPSDVKNVQGKMHETTVPRIPGRDFSGVVVGGRGALSGQSVFGSGGNLGFGRDGSHAEFVVVPANAVIPLPRNLSFEQAAGIGVAYMTAWAALVNAARIQPGETALILGTTGAVGSAAARIAHSLGGRACTAQVDAGPRSEGSPAICARTTVRRCYAQFSAAARARRNRAALAAAGTALVVAAIASGAWLHQSAQASAAMERSIAVLPFENLSPNGRDFSSGSGGEPRSYVSAPKGPAQEDLQFSEMSSLESLKRYDD